MSLELVCASATHLLGDLDDRKGLRPRYPGQTQTKSSYEASQARLISFLPLGVALRQPVRSPATQAVVLTVSAKECRACDERKHEETMTLPWRLSGDFL
jgi:hypothetical protein